MIIVTLREKYLKIVFQVRGWTMSLGICLKQKPPLEELLIFRFTKRLPKSL